MLFTRDYDIGVGNVREKKCNKTDASKTKKTERNTEKYAISKKPLLLPNIEIQST